MSRNLRISIGVVVAAFIALLVAVNVGGNSATAPADSRLEQVIRPDSPRLSVAEDGKVNFVEFLDFECEACLAAYPAVEELRRIYDGRVTFVVRYFPLHYNSEAASRAAEAAGAQGRFEDMYHRLFETQPEWGEKQTSEEELFFGFAEDLGLDMDEFRAVYDDPATIARVQRDQADGRALGVTGTPTFFLNDEKLEVSSFQQLIDLIDAALAA